MSSHSTRDSAPLGVKLLAALAFADAGQMLLSGLPKVLFGVPGWIVFLVFAGIALSQVLTGIGLLMMEPYAYQASLASFTLGLLGDLLSGNLLGAVSSLVILTYLYAQRGKFRKRG
jgi:hypothetical protein